MIEVSQLTKMYGTTAAIDSLNFTINKGEVVGFLGPNGAGKSTTMKIITGFMAPTSGTARVAGHDVFENPIEVKKHIGYLPETPPVYGEMLVEEYLQFVADLKKVPKFEKNKWVSRAIEKTNLGPVRRRLIQNLRRAFVSVWESRRPSFQIQKFWCWMNRRWVWIRNRWRKFVI